MKTKRYPIFLPHVLSWFVFTSFLANPASFAGDPVALPPFARSDRVLILAPHPDDETAFTGGVIQRAVKAGARGKVVLLTSGENNLLSFMIHKKRFFFGPKRIIRMGTMRKQETVQAMQRLGLAEDAVISLGYPDSATLEIMTKRWGNAKPLSGKFSHARRVPYSDALSPGAPYVGESILKDLERVLLEYKPTKIFVSHPADLNPDHQALYLFMQVALWDLEGQIERPDIYPYLVHAKNWPSSQGYQPELKLDVPPGLISGRLSWQHFDLSPDEISTKYGALQAYPSQIHYAPNRLVSFVRQNELFGDYPIIKIGQPLDSKVLSYAKQGDNFVINIKLKRRMSKWLGASITLLGYKKGVSFSVMPKIEIILKMNRFYIKDKKERIAQKDVQSTAHGKQWFLSIPLSLLGNPDFILSSAKTSLKDLSMDERAWRILELEQTVVEGAS